MVIVQCEDGKHTLGKVIQTISSSEYSTEWIQCLKCGFIPPTSTVSKIEPGWQKIKACNQNLTQ